MAGDAIVTVVQNLAFHSYRDFRLLSPAERAQYHPAPPFCSLNGPDSTLAKYRTDGFFSAFLKNRVDSGRRVSYYLTYLTEKDM